MLLRRHYGISLEERAGLPVWYRDALLEALYAETGDADPAADGRGRDVVDVITRVG